MMRGSGLGISLKVLAVAEDLCSIVLLADTTVSLQHRQHGRQLGGLWVQGGAMRQEREPGSGTFAGAGRAAWQRC
jgi:hypothetical protein